jgi:hypothetical protein
LNVSAQSCSNIRSLHLWNGEIQFEARSCHDYCEILISALMPKVMYLLQGSCCSNKWISIVEMMTTCCQAKWKNSASWFFKGQKHGDLNKHGTIRVGPIDVSSTTVVGFLPFFFSFDSRRKACHTRASNYRGISTQTERDT